MSFHSLYFKAFILYLIIIVQSNEKRVSFKVMLWIQPYFMNQVHFLSCLMFLFTFTQDT